MSSMTRAHDVCGYCYCEKDEDGCVPELCGDCLHRQEHQSMCDDRIDAQIDQWKDDRAMGLYR